MKTLIIIPAYNEESNIEAVIESIRGLNEPDIDIIVIDDCSLDHTRNELKQMNQAYVSHPINLGIGGAMQTGYKYAYDNGYDIAIQIDGDGQHDVSYIPELIKYVADDEADMVVGSRFILKEGFQSSVARRIGIRILSTIIKIKSGKNVKDVTSGYRAVNKRIIERFARYYPTDYPEPETLASVLISGYRVKETPVIMREREFGKSSINLFRSVYYMVKVSFAIIICSRLES